MKGEAMQEKTVTRGTTAAEENELAALARLAWEDNAVEALVGALSSVTTPDQFRELLVSLRHRCGLWVSRLADEDEEADDDDRDYIDEWNDENPGDTFDEIPKHG